MEESGNYIIGNIIVEDLFYIALGVIVRILVQIVDFVDERSIKLKKFCKERTFKWIFSFIIAFPIVFFVAESVVFLVNHFREEEFVWATGASGITAFFTAEVVKLLRYIKNKLPKYATDKIDNFLGRYNSNDRLQSDDTEKS